MDYLNESWFVCYFFVVVVVVCVVWCLIILQAILVEY